MRRICILGFIFFIGAFELPAQLTGYVNAAGPNATIITQNSDSGDSSEIPQGVIRVRKGTITPYVKVEYKYYLARIDMVDVPVPVDNGVAGNTEMKAVPVVDSAVFSRTIKRVYPKKTGESPLLSKMFVDNMKYLYSSSDTGRIDTMVIGLWITDRGVIRRVFDDPEYTLEMPDQMAEELTRTSQQLSGDVWGEAGGYYQGRKKMFRSSPLRMQSYYCEMFVIVSSYPLTQEQKIPHYAAFDYPLNSPPTDEQQRASMEKNGMKLKSEAEPKR